MSGTRACLVVNNWLRTEQSRLQYVQLMRLMLILLLLLLMLLVLLRHVMFRVKAGESAECPKIVGQFQMTMK